MIAPISIAEAVFPKIADLISSASGAVVAVGAIIGLPIAYWQLIKWRLEIVTSKKQKTAEEVLEAVKSIELSLEHIRVPGKKDPLDDRRGTRVLESVRRDHIGLHSFRSISLMDARRRNARAF
jgi:hypothetical protein